MIDTVILNKNLLATWFERLTDVDWSNNTVYSLLNPNSDSISHRIHALLSPKDTQDVPRAIKLLSVTADLRNLDDSEFNPSELKTHRALSLLGELLESLLLPFIDPNFTISQQITSLAKFAFIACALFLKHEGDFMPQHLYSDLQCMVRTAIFRVAHMKILDPERRVLLCLLGDDVLEILFGRSRMIGGHSPNVDPVELCNRFRSALRLDSIFQDYPQWERRPQRLNLKRNRDADHLSPRNWQGELRASSCDLKACWMEGMSQAEAILAKFGYPIHFEGLFRDWRTRGVDLMRPKGGKYPGISKEIDRSLSEEDSVGQEDVDDSYRDFQKFDGKAVYEAELEEERRVAEDEPHSIWMDLGDGKKGHKKTILRIFMDPSLDVDYNRSHDRLLRVRYFSIGGDGWDRSKSTGYSTESASANLFNLESLYATLICVEKTKICVGILRCVALKLSSQHLDRAPADEICLPDSNYEVSGQILSLIPFTCDTNNSDSTQSGSTISWAWNADFVSLNTTKSTSSRTRQPQPTSTTRVQHLSFAVNGRLIYVLRPSQIKPVSVDNIPLNLGSSVNRTWVITERDLQEIKLSLLNLVAKDDDARLRIPLFSNVRSGSFPYTAADSKCLSSYVAQPHSFKLNQI